MGFGVQWQRIVILVKVVRVGIKLRGYLRKALGEVNELDV